MSEAQKWKEIANKLAVALAQCLSIGIAKQPSEAGEKVRVSFEESSWAAIDEWGKANGRG